MENNKWILHHGIHRRTITSRDSASATYDTREEALESFYKQKEWYRSIGYEIWFAHLVSPEGVKETIDYGTPYW